MIVQTLYSVAKDLFGIFSKLDEKKTARTIRTADYFSSLAQVIENTSAALKKGQYPHGECAQLLLHAKEMKKTIGNRVKNAEKYAKKVKQVWEIERLHAELSSAPKSERTAKLKMLDEAAGYFRGIAAHLRVSA